MEGHFIEEHLDQDEKDLLESIRKHRDIVDEYVDLIGLYHIALLQPHLKSTYGPDIGAVHVVLLDHVYFHVEFHVELPFTDDSCFVLPYTWKSPYRIISETHEFGISRDFKLCPHPYGDAIGKYKAQTIRENMALIRRLFEDQKIIDAMFACSADIWQKITRLAKHLK